MDARRLVRSLCSTATLGGGALAVGVLAGVLSCGGGSEVVIGPEGGTVSAHGFTLIVPEGALSVERTITIAKSENDLGRRDFSQVGTAVVIEPTDLQFKIPAVIQVDDASDAEDPAVLHGIEDRVSAFIPVESGSQAQAHIIRLGDFALAEAGDLLGEFAAPELAIDPTSLSDMQTHTGSLTMNFTPDTANPFSDIVLTAYDMAGAYNRPLNDNSDNSTHCGFSIDNVSGGAVTAGCVSGLISSSIQLNSSSIEFDVSPFLIDKVDTPVAVLVGVGSGDFVTNIGYFGFKTGPCFKETCSGRGMCVESGGSASCMCNDGYAPGEEPLSCACVPQCDGKQCGDDGCGGSCAPGCSGEDVCNSETFQCETPEPMTTGPDPTTEDPTTEDPTTEDPTTEDPTTSTTDPTTEDPTTDGSTTDPTTGGMTDTDSDSDTDTGSTT